MDAADLFYSRLLASLGPEKEEPGRPASDGSETVGEKNEDEGRKAPPVAASERRKRSPSVEEIAPPVAPPTRGTSVKRKLEHKPSVEATPLVTPSSTPRPSVAMVPPTAAPPATPAPAPPARSAADSPAAGTPPLPVKAEKAPITPPLPGPAPTPPPKTTSALEAELRARLLAASQRKRKGCPPLSKSSAPPPKKPHRGSPVFTTVPVASASPPPITTPDSPNPSHPAEKISSHTRNSSLCSVSGQQQKLALPPKPIKRSPFALRISVPFPYASHPAGKITLETESLPLETPITALLDVFGRRGETDCLWFPPLGEDSVRPEGQCFFRQQRRSSERMPGWRQGGGIGLGLGLEAKKSTLEDVYVPLGERAVECDLLAAPPPQATKSREFEGEEEEADNTFDGGPDVYEISPHDQSEWNDGCEEGEWVEVQDGEMDWEDGPSPQDHHGIVHGPWQGPFAWQGPAVHQFPSPQQQHMGQWFGPQHYPDMAMGDAQRWIPGHHDYESARWMFGFNHGMPVPPPSMGPMGPHSNGDHAVGPSGGHSRVPSLNGGLQPPTPSIAPNPRLEEGVNGIVSPPLEASTSAYHESGPDPDPGPAPGSAAASAVPADDQGGSSAKAAKKQRKKGGRTGGKFKNKRSGPTVAVRSR